MIDPDKLSAEDLLNLRLLYWRLADYRLRKVRRSIAKLHNVVNEVRARWETEERTRTKIMILRRIVLSNRLGLLDPRDKGD